MDSGLIGGLICPVCPTVAPETVYHSNCPACVDVSPDMDTVSLGGAKRMSFSRLGMRNVSSLSWIFSFVVHQLVPTKMAVGGGQRNLWAVSPLGLLSPIAYLFSVP